MNTLTIPFAGASSGLEAREVVIDTNDLVTLQQVNNTTTVLYVSNANAGTITLTHTATPGGQVGDAINDALIKSNQGNTIVALPRELPFGFSGPVTITNVVYS